VANLWDVDPLVDRNYGPLPGSPLVGAGIVLPGLTTDFSGEPRPSPPTIGALEPSETIASTMTPDTTPPVTTSDAVATYMVSATIKLTATDSGSGVAATYYSLDGGTQVSGTVVSVLTPGTHTLGFWSVDSAGNVEASKTKALVVSALPPASPNAAATSITIKTSATSTSIGETPVLSGSITPNDIIGKVIVVWVKKPGQRYWTYSSNRIAYSLYGNAAWQYKYYFKPGMKKGIYTFKASIPAYSSYGASASPATVSIRLK
jgi:hypothetical protein